MTLKIIGLHFDVTSAIRTHIEEKLERIYRHCDNILSITITLSVEKLVHKAGAQMHLAGKDVYMEAVEQDMYVAIDILMDKLDRSVVQYKEKHAR